MTKPTIDIYSLFPSAGSITKRDSDLNPREEKEIEKIIKNGMHRNVDNSGSNNSYIFNENLKELKQFCEYHINVYVKETINPKDELDFYITQSWLNITKPGESHHEHWHSNSIISGVFYISTEEGDNITFIDPNIKLKQLIFFKAKEFNLWNSSIWSFPSKTNELILFPSWVNHQVEVNEKATTDRISIAFNTFVKGSLGSQETYNELILK